jgi:hypothetical protein
VPELMSYMRGRAARALATSEAAGRGGDRRGRSGEWTSERTLYTTSPKSRAKP